MRYFILKTKDKVEILGSDGVSKFDQRYSNGMATHMLIADTMQAIATHERDDKYLKPKHHYADLVQGTLRKWSVLIKNIDLRCSDCHSWD